MRRYRIVVAYDGSNYCGWQIQPNGITVEEVLNKKLLKNRLAKICFLSGVYHFGKTDLGIKTSLSFLNDKSLDVVGEALWGIIFYNDVKYVKLIVETQKKYSQETEIYSRCRY